MRNVWNLALGVLLGGTSLVPAQTPTPSTPQRAASAPAGGSLLSSSTAPATPRLDPVAGPTHSEAVGLTGGDDHDDACFWASAEYLLWWIKGGPTPPLVTTGNATTDILAGTFAVGQTSTSILFGARAIDYNSLSGFRATVGGWADSDRGIGFEASGFYLPRRSVTFHAASDMAGNPPLFVPVFRPDLGKESIFTIANPINAVNIPPFANGTAGVTGAITIAAPTELYGYEFNTLACVVRRDGLQLSGLVGFRYMDLRESIGISAPNLLDTVNAVTDNITESFSTRNTFYGGQIGAWFVYHAGILSAELTTKLALGDSHQVVDVQGVTVQNSPTGVAPSGTFAGGILTQASNIGRRTHEQFTVIPEVKVQLGCNILENLRAFVSYDFLYWNQVVRPGAEIDRNVNPTQSPVGPTGGVFAPPLAPLPQFNRTDFWAQGVSCGIELRF
jgi:hypothetical protein